MSFQRPIGLSFVKCLLSTPSKTRSATSYHNKTSVYLAKEMPVLSRLQQRDLPFSPFPLERVCRECLDLSRAGLSTPCFLGRLLLILESSHHYSSICHPLWKNCCILCPFQWIMRLGDAVWEIATLKNSLSFLG